MNSRMIVQHNSSFALHIFTLRLLSMLATVMFLVDQGHPDWQSPHYVGRYPIILIILSLIVIISWLAGAKLHFHQSSALIVFNRTIAVVVGFYVILGGLWFILPSEPNHSITTIIRVYLCIVAILICTVFLGAINRIWVQISQIILITIVTIGLALILNIFLIGRVPELLNYDEPGEVNLSYFVVKTGNYQWPMYPTMSPTQVALAMPLLNLGAGWWMQIFHPGFVQMRVFFLIFGWLCIPFVFFVVNHLYGRAAAFIATLLIPFIIIIHNYARPDIFVCLAFSFGLACFFQARKKGHPLWHYLTGLIIAFGIEGHPYAVRYVFAFGMLYLFEYIVIRKMRQGHSVFWAFVMGNLSFVLVFVLLHYFVLPVEQRIDPIQTLQGIYSTQALGAKSQIVGRNIFERIYHENLIFYGTSLQLYPAEFLLLSIGIVAATFRHTNNDKILLWLFFSSSFIGAILLAHSAIHHWTYNIPFIVIFIGGAIRQISREYMLSIVGLSIVVAFIVILTADILERAVRPHPSDEYLEISAQLDRLIPSNTIIVGHSIYYLAMPYRKDYVSIENYYGSRNMYGGPNTADLKQPQALIFTAGNGYMNDPNTSFILPYIKKYNLKPAYCFKTNFENEVILYLTRNYVFSNEKLKCEFTE